jgi:hypothetical protein
VTDDALRAELKRIATRVHLRALATAAALTFILWWLPL